MKMSPVTMHALKGRILKTHARESIALAALALGMLLTAGAAAGIVLVPVSDESLADAAAVIVHARIASSEVVDSAGGAVTRYEAEAIRSFKGAAERVRFDLPGGSLGNGTTLWVPGMPAFQVGDEVLLFLERRPGGSLRPAFGVQGIFSHQASLEGPAWRPAAAGAGVDVLGSAERYRAVRHGTRFVDWLTDRARGLTRPPDYRIAPSPAPPAPPPNGFPTPKFTLRTPLLRWTAFDRGESVPWFWIVPPGSGDVAPVLEAFKDARQLWNRAPRAGVRMVPGGLTDAMTVRDDVSIIAFEDPSDIFDSEYDCERGGLVGGLLISLDFETHDWKGRTFRNVQGADFVFNKGTACRLPSLADTRFFALNLGRVLGLDASCGGVSRRPCVPGTPEGDAVMSGSLISLNQPLALSSDDVDGMRYLYDASFDGAPTSRCPFSPGHPRYCTECGPCTARLGDCDRDSECAPGTVCVNDRGADFGYAPGIDVCLPSGDGGGGGGGPGPGPQCSLGSGRYCTDCGPCANGQGDCDSDAECGPGLTCVDNVGAQFGFAPGVDVCLPGGPPPMCMSSLGRGDFCGAPGCGPCGAGEGDCDNDSECAPGLRCVEDIGPQFGFGARVDVCQ